jgi:hypothetical protein
LRNRSPPRSQVEIRKVRYCPRDQRGRRFGRPFWGVGIFSNGAYKLAGASPERAGAYFCRPHGVAEFFARVFRARDAPSTTPASMRISSRRCWDQQPPALQRLGRKPERRTARRHPPRRAMPTLPLLLHQPNSRHRVKTPQQPHQHPIPPTPRRWVKGSRRRRRTRDNQRTLPRPKRPPLCRRTHPSWHPPTTTTCPRNSPPPAPTDQSHGTAQPRARMRPTQTA